ncbi:MAG: 2-amino-4-hydroxy-6-hydroxymethyldihydropteridine diphosphokinase [Lachnospiraceae bacterium]|nr:2-amino-4-hydroxy-6-hydroxymethyldihydropteridine diphosphokinase [Lachnospiraceae bacterium]
MDSIIIRDLEVYAGHGVWKEETDCGQSFMINADLNTDLRPAGIRDDLSCSTDYGRVCRFISDYLRQNTFLLIEAAAEHLAEEILLTFPLIRELTLEIKKPSAPVGLPLSYVSVQIRRGWKRAYLGIGSNMGAKERYLEEAVEKLRANQKIRGVKCSELITTAPYGGVEQDDFLNGAVELETLLAPKELLAFLNQLEEEAGRERKIHWGPRTLDLDILFFEDYVSDDPALTVPHPDMENRRFVLEPLSALCPYYVHPLSGKTVKQMLKEL